MNKFSTKTCPLCGKKLRSRYVSKVHIYNCETTFEIQTPNGTVTKTHYEVEKDWRRCIQHMYAYPWGIDSFEGEDKSRIYKGQLATYKGETFHQWKFVTEIPYLREDTEDKLRDRINLLVAFL